MHGEPAQEGARLQTLIARCNSETVLTEWGNSSPSDFESESLRANRGSVILVVGVKVDTRGFDPLGEGAIPSRPVKYGIDPDGLRGNFAKVVQHESVA